MAERVDVPFTDEQVESLNAYQKSDYVHPYTCVCGDHIKLVATKDGWKCPRCTYTQLWAHLFTADWSWKILEMR
jgi:hypothetical protein